MKMEQTECSEMSAYKIQTPGNCLEESTQHSEHGESLKSGIQARSRLAGRNKEMERDPQNLGRVQRQT